MRKFIDVAAQLFENDEIIRYKAGIIPYRIKTPGVIEMCFMISSDPAYGGPAPTISKGGDSTDDANPLETAIREATEEIGFNRGEAENIFPVWQGNLKGMARSYPFYLFAAKMKANAILKPSSYEVRDIVWLTYEKFMKIGRKSQQAIVTHAVKQMK